MFKVYCHLKFGIDDTYDCPYSEIEHETKESAEKELLDAETFGRMDNNFIYAYVKEED